MSATGVPESVLKQTVQLWHIPIAERMSWAAYRLATRTEDIAYCLLGLFEVNMPLLYGEGEKAFARLQEHIIRQTVDLTFLLCGSRTYINPLLATSPADYRKARGLGLRYMKADRPFVLTNIGLEIEADLVRWQPNVYGLVLAWSPKAKFAVLLHKHPWLDAYYRIGTTELDSDAMDWSRKKRITIPRCTKEQTIERDIQRFENLEPQDFRFQISTSSSLVIRPIKFHYGLSNPCEKQWTTEEGSCSLECVFTQPFRPAFARMLCEYEGQVLLIDLSFDFESRPCALISKSDEPSNRPPVREISDDQENERSMEPWHEDLSKAVWVHLGRHPCYFLRAETNREMVAKLPTEFVKPQIWLSFIPPQKPQIRCRRWMFQLSTEKLSLFDGIIEDDRSYGG